MGKLLKTVISVGVILVLAAIALNLLKFTLAVVLPIAILAIVAYVIYVLITGKRP